MSLYPEKQIGDYLLDNLIAKGGMGEVWHALDLVRNEPVAIKVVSNDLFSEPGFKVRIQDEANRHQRLHHPNIVPVLDVFEAGGDTCIVMGLVEGQSLADLLKSRQDNRLSAEEAIPIIKDVLDALDYAHRNGVVHRDMKPSNVILNKDNRAIVIDFGIAIALGEKRRTRTGQIVGTPLYMSPEQIAKPQNINHLSDVYSTGCMLYEMVTGRPPFLLGDEAVGNSEFDIQRAHVQKKPVNPKHRAPSLPPYVDELIMKALEKDPEKRIPGCQEFSRLLENMGTEAVDSQEVSGRAELFGLNKPRVVIGMVVIVVLLVLILLLVLLLNY